MNRTPYAKCNTEYANTQYAKCNTEYANTQYAIRKRSKGPMRARVDDGYLTVILRVVTGRMSFLTLNHVKSPLSKLWRQLNIEPFDQQISSCQLQCGQHFWREFLPLGRSYHSLNVSCVTNG